MRLFALILTLLSFNVFAGYRCDITVLNSEKENLFANTSIEADSSEFKKEAIQNYLGKNLTLDFMISGWSGEEEATFTLKKSNDLVSEKASLRGVDKKTIWFDSYKFEIDCSHNKGAKALVSKN